MKAKRFISLVLAVVTALSLAACGKTGTEKRQHRLPNRPDALRIPIIAMTANAFVEDVQASLDAGMNGHLSKPIVMDEVVKAIARNISRR